MTTGDGPWVQVVIPPPFPQEFLNWIWTWSCSLKGFSIRFLDDWWTWLIESQLLYSQWDNWVTRRANWLLCYGMHHGKLSKLPGAWTASPELRSDIMLVPWNIWWAGCHYRKWLAFLISLLLCRLKPQNQALTINPVCGSSLVWRSNILCAGTENQRDFRTLWSITALVSGIIA